MDTTISQPPFRMKWYEICREIWFSLRPETFQEIIRNEKLAPSRWGFTFVAITTFIGMFIYQLSPVSNQGSFFGFVLGVIFGVITTEIALAFSAGIYHLTARLFHGTGSFGKLVFSLATIQGPVFVVSSLFTLIRALFGSGWLMVAIIGIPTLIVGILALVLYIAAIQAVEGINQKEATLTWFLASLVVGVIVVAGIIALLPAIG